MGTLNSQVSIDRQPLTGGPVPVATAGGEFEVDLSAVTGNFLYMVVSSDQPHTTTWEYSTWLLTPPTVVMAARPLDLDDLKEGRYCSKTGWFVPKSRLGYFKGRPYFDRVCPTGQPGPEALEPPPGILVTND